MYGLWLGKATEINDAGRLGRWVRRPPFLPRAAAPRDDGNPLIGGVPDQSLHRLDARRPGDQQRWSPATSAVLARGGRTVQHVCVAAYGSGRCEHGSVPGQGRLDRPAEAPNPSGKLVRRQEAEGEA